MIVEASQRQYKKFIDIVYEECGINLREGKLELLKARLAKRMRNTKINSLRDYEQLIREDANEFLNFIDAVSTNHTFFFRENHHCEFVIRNVTNSNHLKIWSAASSSGEEPYSIAIQLLDKGYRFDIFASDISNTMLSLAKRGIYHKDRVRLVPQQVLRRYFQKGCDKWEDCVRVKGEIKKLVNFGRHNLIIDESPGIFDIIFCRNVMIYFDDRTRQKLVDKLYNSLRKGGYLVIGAAEGLVGLQYDFQYAEPSIYRK
ncbi:MAG: CheR family methyltransferase [Thermodesulfobacteriota bacterium]|nr:CheR family methyltransferase [Thermodesulfobacteriota bacterium]